MDDAVLSVSALTERLRQALEGEFPFVWVRGEVTNLGRPGSGHVYFSLRDGEALLNCVWFKGRQRPCESFDPLTGEVYEDGPRESLAKTMRDGDTITCAGRITVFGPRGQYQLLVDMAQDAGQGELLRRLEAMKRKLSERGWFSQERKRPLPAAPSRVAVLTAPTGAAIHDFVRIAQVRGVGAEIRILPVPVQGDAAAPAIIRALERVNAEDWAEVAVIIRGGGSLEDLWAFNDEKLAEAVVHSRVPVLAGIGHEVDVSICDLVADCRAATPSHAAQILWREREWYAQRLDDLTSSLSRFAQLRLNGCAVRLDAAGRALNLLSPSRRLSWRGERLDGLEMRLSRAVDEARQRMERRIAEWALRLEARDPETPLTRGYAMVFDADGALVRGARDVAPGASLSLRLHDGEIAAQAIEVSLKSSYSK